jgi:predicted N-acetyltransferase YhbS
MSLQIALLADHPEVLGELADSLKREWPQWYGVHADATAELQERLRRTGLPIGLVALDDGKPVGTIAISERSTRTHAHLTPWFIGLWVAPDYRNKNLGVALIRATCDHVRVAGYAELYTTTARFRRPPPPWESLGRGITDGGDAVNVFRLALA